jgi:uncharacterized protein YukE
MTSPEVEFRVHLDALENAAATVKRERDQIEDRLAQIRSHTQGTVPTAWDSPAYGTFEPFRIWFDKASDDVMGLLQEIITRLEVTHSNYRNAELANYGNLDGKLD